MVKILAVQLAVVAMALGISGCRVGPDYQRPGDAVQLAWSATASPSIGPTTLPAGVNPTSRPSVIEQGGSITDRWWATFNDLALNEIVQQAAQSNLGLADATARVRAARARLSGARAGLYPTAAADGGYQFDHHSGPLSPLDTHDYNFLAAGFDAAYEIDVFGGTRRSIEEATANTEALEEARRDVLVSLLAEICRDYIDLRTVQRRADIASDNLKTATELLNLSQRRRAAGVAGDLDVARARAEVTTTAAALPALDARAKQLIHALGILLGASPDTLMTQLSTVNAIPQSPPHIPVGLPSQLLRRRPDVRRAERQLAAATASIGVAESNLYPKFSLTGDIGVGDTESGELFNWSSHYVSVGPQVRWLLFDAGRVLADVDSRKAIREQVLADYKQAILSATRDVEDSVIAFDREQQRRNLFEQSVEASKVAVRIARDEYAGGITGFLTVLDAERSLFAAQDAAAQSDGAISIDLVSLYKALGGGWQTAEQMLPSAQPYPRPALPAAVLAAQ